MTPERFTMYFMSLLICLITIRVAWLYFDPDPPRQQTMLHPSSMRDLNRHLSSSSARRPVFVMCYASWCPNCSAARMEFSNVFECALNDPGAVPATFAMVDIDQVPEIVRMHAIDSVPMVLMFQGLRKMKKLKQDIGPNGFTREIREVIGGDRSLNC